VREAERVAGVALVPRVLVVLPYLSNVPRLSVPMSCFSISAVQQERERASLLDSSSQGSSCRRHLLAGFPPPSLCRRGARRSCSAAIPAPARTRTRPGHRSAAPSSSPLLIIPPPFASRPARFSPLRRARHLLDQSARVLSACSRRTGDPGGGGAGSRPSAALLYA